LRKEDKKKLEEEEEENKIKMMAKGMKCRRVKKWRKGRKRKAEKGKY